MISELISALLVEMLRFDLSGQFMWLILIAFMVFCTRLALRGAGDMWVQSAPSTLLSMGVLGTFAGVVSGLSGFNVDQIDDSIGSVLAGLSTAFYTSLFAMALSLVFKVIQIYGLQRLRSADDSDAAEDIGEKLLMETRQSVKQLRQLNQSSREHSEYLIHITNAVADSSDSNSLLGHMALQRQSFEQGLVSLVSEVSQLREKGDASLDALMLLHQQQQQRLDAAQINERDLRNRLDGLQQVLMTMPNRRDFRALGAVMAARVGPAEGTAPARRAVERPCP